MTLERISLGKAGEDLAARCYEKYGWTILDRNWRCKEGELDIVAFRNSDGNSGNSGNNRNNKNNGNKRKTIAFCEVKTRSSLAFGSPGEAITYQKQKRIRGLAAKWLREKQSSFKNIANSEIRFDAAEVICTAETTNRRINKVSIFTYS